MAPHPPVALLIMAMAPTLVGGCSAGGGPSPDLHENPVSVTRWGPTDGPLVVLVHGTPGSASGWKQMAEVAPPSLRVVAIDRPGFGRSPERRAVTSLDTQARAVGRVLEEQGDAVLLGHSLGGSVVALAAALYPKRVRGIVIAAGALDPDLEKIFVIQRLGSWIPFRWLLPRFMRNANAELLAYEAELRKLAPRLAEIRCPVVVIHGTRDGLVPYANVTYMRERFAGTKLDVVTLEDVGHLLPWREETTLWEWVLRLLDQPVG